MDFATFLWWLVIPFSLFAFVIFIGAPYLPSKKSNLDAALKKLKIKPGQKLVDLGSGDGAVMLRAGRLGLKTHGVEANPLLALISRLRLRKVANAQVEIGNFWHRKIPTDTDYLYVFLHPRFMDKLAAKLEQELSSKAVIVSFAFEIPGWKPMIEESGYFIYRLPVAKASRTK